MAMICGGPGLYKCNEDGCEPLTDRLAVRVSVSVLGCYTPACLRQPDCNQWLTFGGPGPVRPVSRGTLGFR